MLHEILRGITAGRPQHRTAAVGRNLIVRFGGVVALAGVSLPVERQQICGLIGPNESGKTTLFNCIRGICRFSQGDVRFNGRSMTGLSRHAMAALGIGRTFQNLALFRSLSVRENVLAGAHHLGRSGFPASMLRLHVTQREEAAAEAGLGQLLIMLGLSDLADTPVSALPFGTQKRVELARALIGRPSLLLLDEPAAGLNHGEVDKLVRLMREIRAHFRTSILLVE